jgi:hypothetical protein
VEVAFSFAQDDTHAGILAMLIITIMCVFMYTILNNGKNSQFACRSIYYMTLNIKKVTKTHSQTNEKCNYRNIGANPEAPNFA